MSSCKSLMKAQLKQAPRKTLTLEVLQSNVVAALVVEGKSQKRVRASIGSVRVLDVRCWHMPVSA